MIKKILAFSMFISHITYAKSSEITNWQNVRVMKGFVLSLNLSKEGECGDIWKKQIKEFKKKNPKIKDPNKIYVNQNISVQSCKVKIEPISEELKIEQKAEIKEAPAKIYSTFAEVYGGISSLGEKKGEDSSKTGYSVGIKLGRSVEDQTKQIDMAVGLLANKSKTDNDNGLGVYEVKTFILTLEGAYLAKIGDSLKLGPKLLLGVSDDLSFKDQKDTASSAGAYLGLEGLVRLSDKSALSIDSSQRIDDLSRKNILLNLGYRFNF